MNISIIGSGQSIKTYDKQVLSDFLSKTFTIGCNYAFKEFPVDMIIMQDRKLYPALKQKFSEHRAVKLLRDWLPYKDLLNSIPNTWLLTEKTVRMFTGVLALELAHEWSKNLGEECKIYLFGIDCNTQKNIFTNVETPPTCCDVSYYAHLKDANAINMSTISALTQYPKSNSISHIVEETQEKKNNFLTIAKQWLTKNKYIKGE